jgi:L-iditol 2-dehydrogenase
MPLRDAKCHVIGGGAIGVGAALALRAFGQRRSLSPPNAVRRATLIGLTGLIAVAPGDVTG